MERILLVIRPDDTARGEWLAASLASFPSNHTYFDANSIPFFPVWWPPFSDEEKTIDCRKIKDSYDTSLEMMHEQAAFETVHMECQSSIFTCGSTHSNIINTNIGKVQFVRPRLQLICKHTFKVYGVSLFVTISTFLILR